MEIDEIKKVAAKASEDYRKANKLTQAQLAKLAKVSVKSIYNIEHSVAVYDETMVKVMKVCGWRYEVKVTRNLIIEKQEKD